MCSLTGKTEEEVYQELKGVIFLNPVYGYGGSDEQKYLMADEYLSGNVREKLAWAKKSAEVYPEDYKINVEALEKSTAQRPDCQRNFRAARYDLAARRNRTAVYV